MRQVVGVAALPGVLGQGLAHFFYQQAVAAVGAHGEQQGALQHVLQGGLVAQHRQGQVARVKQQAVRRRRKARRAIKQHLVAGLVRGRGKAQLGALQRNARVRQPAGHSQRIAQHRHHTKFLQNAQAAHFAQLQRGQAIVLGERERNVVGQQAMVAAPALQGHL